MPGNHLPGKQVDDHAELIPLIACPEIGDVAGPDKIWGVLNKLLLQMVFAFPSICAAAVRFRFFCGHFRKFHTAHQAVHSPDADDYAIVTLKDMPDFVCARALVIIRIDMQDRTPEFLVLRSTGSRSCSEMLVISTPVETQNPT